MPSPITGTLIAPAGWGGLNDYELAKLVGLSLSSTHREQYLAGRLAESVQEYNNLRLQRDRDTERHEDDDDDD